LNSHNVWFVSRTSQSRAVNITVPEFVGSSSFPVLPVLVFRADQFITVFLSVGGLVHIFDAAHFLGKDRSQVHRWVKRGRFTRYCFPFGQFLSVSELSAFSPSSVGRPLKVSEPEATIRRICVEDSISAASQSASCRGDKSRRVKRKN
jgi:hypothetical protein